MATIKVSSEFFSVLKRLSKKYPSLRTDMKGLQAELQQNPLLGTDLGSGLHKIRLAITSKGKGKSGGARVITHVEIIVDNPADAADEEVLLLTMYDKSEVSNLKKNELLKILSKYK